MMNRDERIDFLRAICTLTIVLAHVEAPFAINQVRAFDVVALVMISGMSLHMARYSDFKKYIAKRLRKLLWPTYIMMAFVFVLSFTLCRVMSISQLYSADQILKSFLLLGTGSMGYVWIVRVYLAIAIATPMIRRVKDVSFPHFCILLAGSSMVLFVLYQVGKVIQNEALANAYLDYIYTDLVYIALAGIGYYIYGKKKLLNVVFAISVGLFACYQLFLFFTDRGFIPGEYKFPPQLYYCCYGIAVTLVLIRALPNRGNVIVSWLSKNSFSIYLWHIVMLRVYGVITKISVFGIFENMWGVEYFCVTVGAIIATLLLNMLVNTRKGLKQ